MPTLPGRPCSRRGCTRLVHGRGVRFCDEHLAEERAKQDALRGTAAQRGYDAAWQEIRARVLAEHPFCACGRRAMMVHHRLSVRDGGTNDEANLVAMCRMCHARLHGVANVAG